MTFNLKRISISKAGSEIVEMMDSSTRSLQLRNEGLEGSGKFLLREEETLVVSIDIFPFVATPLRGEISLWSWK